MSETTAPEPSAVAGGSAPDNDNDKLTPDILKVAGVVVLGAIMSILDITVVNVALPTFQKDFGVDELSTVAWTVTAYTLALATVIPLTGWAADRFGTKRLYMIAVALFTLGSVLCATAWNIESLVAFRVVQGLGGGMLMPLGMTIMTRAAGPQRMGRLMAILGVPMLLGPIGGPILGGWLIDIASWHWVFLINLPLGLIGLILAARIFPKDSPEPSETFDFIGMLLMSPGLALFLFGVSSIPETGTIESARVLIPGIVGIVLIVAFVFYSFRPKHPLLDLRLFKNRDLAVSSTIMVLFVMAFFGSLLLIPTYFQQVRGESVLQAGLLVAPQGLGAMLTMPIAGTLTDRLPVGRIVPFGFLTIIVGMIGLAQIDATTPYIQIMGWLFVLGLGMGGTMMPIMTSALKTLKAHDVARGSTLINVIQQVGSSMGVALMTVLLTNHFKDSEAIVAGQAIEEATKAGTQPPADALQVAAQYGDGFMAKIYADMASSFTSTFWVALAILVVALIPVALLPRKKRAVDDVAEGDAPPVLVH